MKDAQRNRKARAVLVALSVLVSIANGTAIAEDYLGEFCWSMVKTEDEAGSDHAELMMRTGVTHVGDGYYRFQGIIDVTSTIGEPLIIQGSAILDGADVLMIINYAQDNSPKAVGERRHSGTGQALLSAATLDGTWWGVEHTFDLSGQEFNGDYSAGTMTFLSCP